MKVILSHPTGNEFVKAACSGLLDANMLAEFFTSIALFQGNYLDNLSRFKPLAEFNRRKFNLSLEPYTRLWPWRELGRHAARKMNVTSLLRHETGAFSVDAVYKSCDNYVASKLREGKQKGIDAIYAYEDGALHSFQQANKLGLLNLYDLPIGYWRTARRLLEVERERWPEWSSTLTGFKDSDEKLARKDEELRLADHIFVASQFTASTLKDYPGRLGPISVIPYGFPPVINHREYDKLLGKRPLKLLFVGGLSQRKGIANLFAAADYLGKNIELTIVGRKSTNDCVALDKELIKYKWISTLPHDKVLELMRQHDVLIFPSLFEGFGLVITEAMAQGTPVITTERTAGADLIQHGHNGWLVEAGSTESLVQAIGKLIDNPMLIPECGQAALLAAKQRPWPVYGHELAMDILKIKQAKK
ncbi:glycosyltransferase family 4 protein [Spirosoma sp. KCTC 42546]|uniref:glycosyltransferase family 4 protein n=1 Tax=Spirosoma sp. KCTC 42546 TaxID=2520506 RepID=UPI00115B3844|nr:glycosyltransferase family 4 protein [Spirosoma sp. KCTC 42546]QDK78672.1 glycosyltransferase family 4 protein [Spirosoma sp. KCTC 42546]